MGLYPHQREAYNELLGWLEEHDRALVVMATGLGKTVVAAHYAGDTAARGRGLVLCHDNHILEQDLSMFREVLGQTLSLGVFHGQRKDFEEVDITFASFQTFRQWKHVFFPDEFHYIIVDEAHHSEADTFRPVVEYFHPRKLLGLTATPDRMDGRDIRQIFGEEVIFFSLEEAIANSWLAAVDYHLLSDHLNTRLLKDILEDSGKGRRRISVKQLNETIFIRKRDEEIARIITGYGKKAIVFCENVDHAETFSRFLPGAKTFHSQHGPGRNQETLDEFRRGELPYILAVNKFNEGIDVPNAELVVFLRCTDSKTVYLQQLGRGLRRTPLKEKVTVLDFVGNCERVIAVQQMVEEVARLSDQKFDLNKHRFQVDGGHFDFTFTDEVKDIIELVRLVQKKLHISEVPHLAAEYLPPPRNLLPAEQVLAGTNKKLWWKCGKCGHEWNTGGNARVRGRGCAACANRVVTATNNLAVTHPDLAAEYMPPPRNKLPAEKVVANTAQELWWKCGKCGHEWLIPGNWRVNGGTATGCPACVNRAVTATNNLAVTHPHLAAEYMPPPRNKLPAEKVLAITHNKLWWKCGKCGHEWNAVGYSRVQGRGCPACSGRVATAKNNLAITHPHLAAEYMPPPRNKLLVEQLKAGTSKKFWWRCSKCGHKWKAYVSNRTIHGSGCPACSGHAATRSNNLAVTHPHLAAEYLPPPRNKLPAKKVIAGTHKKLWWKCGECGHEWRATGDHRVRGAGCPACSKRRRKQGN